MLFELDILVVLDLIKFLQPFEEATKALEGGNLPTLPKVYLCFSKLKWSMEKVRSDSEVLSFLKNRGLKCLEEKFIITDLHLLALFLNSKFKTLRSPDLTHADRESSLPSKIAYVKNCPIHSNY